MSVLANTVLMVRPDHFRMNEQTAEDNDFQDASLAERRDELSEAALRESADLVDALRAAGIRVIYAVGDPDLDTPDEVFPNNWFTSHPQGYVLHAMRSPNRRLEVQEGILDQVREHVQIGEEAFVDFTSFVEEDRFMEGTGVMIFDRKNKIVYAALSERADEGLLQEFTDKIGYEKLVTFETRHLEIDRPIYHTNVIMALGKTTAVVCMEVIPLEEDKEKLRVSLGASGHTIVDISFEQVKRFAGNMIQLENAEGEAFWVMSRAAHDCLSEEQRAVFESDGGMIVVDVSHIEKAGGGSVRCMIAEVFPKTTR